MKKSDAWPPPEWTEVVIKWDEILNEPKYPIRDILAWVDETPGDVYHLHGYKATEGFAFRFRDPRDATKFRIVWS